MLDTVYSLVDFRHRWLGGSATERKEEITRVTIMPMRQTRLSIKRVSSRFARQIIGGERGGRGTRREGLKMRNDEMRRKLR